MSGYSPRFPNAPPRYDPINESQFRAALRQALQDSTSPLAGTLDLDDLDDVNVPGPSDDDVLGWSTDRWVAVSQLAASQISEAAVTQHQAALAIATSQVTSGTFADARIAESNVTQHEAALAIAASQIAFSAGVGFPTLDTRNDNDPPSTFNKEWLVELKTLSAVGLTEGSGTYGGQITIAPWSDNSGDAHHQINLNEGGLFWRQGQPDNASWEVWSRIYTEEDPSGNEKLRLRHASATGSPYLSFYQAGTRRAFVGFDDSDSAMRFRSEQTGIYDFEDSGGTWNVVRINDGTDFQIYLSPPAGNDAGIRIEATGAAGPTGGHAFLELLGDATNVFGDPGGAYVRFSQDNGAVEAMVGITQSGAWPNRDALSGVSGNQFIIGTKFSASMQFIVNDAIAATLASGGDFTAQGDVIATVP